MISTMRAWSIALATSSVLLGSCANKQAKPEQIYQVGQAGLSIEFDHNLHSRVISRLDGSSKPLGDYLPSEYLIIKPGKKLSEFEFVDAKETSISTELGQGKQTVLTGLSKAGIQKSVSVQAYPDFPDMLFFNVSYQNNSNQPVIVTKWVQHAYQLKVNTEKSIVSAKHNGPEYWSYQGSSHEDRRDWVLPLSPGFEQQNYMGMNASDYGSGTAIADVWRKDVGMAIGHAEIHPKLVSLPVSYKNSRRGATMDIELEKNVKLLPGQSMQTLDTFVAVHQRDYYSTLAAYRQVMAKKGLIMAKVPDSAYEPIWCAWGYERAFSVDEVVKTLPKAKQMGLEWAVLDDGWQTAEGDWYLDKQKFPNGDKDMQALVTKIKQAGLKAKLWWAPLAVDPGTDLLREHPDMLLLNKNGTTQDITWWDSYYLCPAYASTRDYTVDLVKKMLGEWGFSGLKIDGQHLNGVPPCYNPAHNHASPEESVEQLADFWKLIYDTAMEINPDAVIEICPCGTSYAFHNLPFMNQAVSSDPLSSWQVRLKGKTIKGLMGDSAPYYGDHVELSDNASDFASSFGIGAVLGTKFTLSSDNNKAAAEFLLDQDKEQVWQHWFNLYNKMMLPKGQYLGELYDIGFDHPEAHAISKDNKMFYAFYAESFSGNLELRGLTAARYRVVDYVKGEDLAVVEVNGKAGTADLMASFKQYLLLELIPID